MKGFINAGFSGIILKDQVCLSSAADNGYIAILEDHTLVLVISSILYVEITV